MKKIVLLICLTLSAFALPGGIDTFNGMPLTKIEQDKYPNALIYSDSVGSQVLQVRLLVTPSGILVPENGTPLEGYVLFPTTSTNLTGQNVSDIFKFIDYLDLSNRMKTDK